MNLLDKYSNYLLFPREIINDVRLNPNEKIIYLGILSLIDKNNFSCEFKYADFRKVIG